MARNRGANSVWRRRFCWTLAGVLVAPALKTAKALGITIPQSLPLRTDEVIQ